LTELGGWRTLHIDQHVYANGHRESMPRLVARAGAAHAADRCRFWCRRWGGRRLADKNSEESVRSSNMGIVSFC